MLCDPMLHPSIPRHQELKRLQAEEERSATRKPKAKIKTTQYSILQEKLKKGNGVKQK